MPVYQPLIPSGTVDLDVDYQNIQDNFNQANIVYGIDHYPFDNNTGNEGFHNQVTLPFLDPPTPTTIAGQGKIYTQDSAATPGRSDLYYAYQTSVGTPFSGTLFPLNIIKAFGRATGAGLVAGSSFNVTTAVFSGGPDRWTITLTSPICANTAPDMARVMVLALPEVGTFDASTACMSFPVLSPTVITIATNGSSVSALSFAILVI